ncbi:MAG: hypothetical protein GQ540_03910 [Lutibacter sp.]|uniref:hypothetical protein n=1 Tax=Lutibacter sp. TaxID=1925666 RepID=UPI0019E83180|nr:hypothetical protein [Lutibacter sp.]NOR27659.1 hypothetical protein [Lutibacter sp.]
MKTIRDELEDAIKLTENEIKESLQRFHNDTGMIPRSISFKLIDIKSCDMNEPGKVIIVNRVDLLANT